MKQPVDMTYQTGKGEKSNMKRMTKKMWAIMLTLAMALSMMLSSVSVFADTTDSLVSSVKIGGVTATYSDFTVTPDPAKPNPEGWTSVTNYFYDAILSEGANLNSVAVAVTLPAAGTVAVEGQEEIKTVAAGGTASFRGVDLSSPKTLTVTSGEVTREYRLSAAAAGTFNVNIAVRTDLVYGYEDVTQDLKDAADTIAAPADGVTFESVTLGAGQTVMDALEVVGTRYGITLNTPANNYISNMQKGGYTLGEFTCGSMSGWMYWVDGELPMVGAGNYTLNGGEIIEWKYIVDYSTVWG